MRIVVVEYALFNTVAIGLAPLVNTVAIGLAPLGGVVRRS
jgi:hypothetical protein